MPNSKYLPERMGSATLSPSGPFVAGAHEELTLSYTAGDFGIDDTGMLKISWRTTSDMSKPQFNQPQAANYTTVEASNGAALEVWFDRLNIRPYGNTLLIRIGRGYLRAGDTLTVRFGDRRQGSPGYRLQTNVEANVELRTSVDAFATYEFCQLPVQPVFDLVAGRPARWKVIVPSLVLVGEPFRLAVVAEDVWGNPAPSAGEALTFAASHPIRGLPGRIEREIGSRATVIDNLIADREGDVDLAVFADGEELARANPMRVGRSAPARRYWGDLHGQSGETIGMGSAEDYFRYARDLAFIDIVGHQGNDFQITDTFWDRLNRLTAAFDAPGRFVCVPGYEWSGNTGMGGDRNIFYRHEGRPIRRSSHILVEGQASTPAIYTAEELFRALDGENAIVVAHVGGRYADITRAHDGRLERAVEVHSTWGTFEWMLHDAFAQGYRVGVVCHSDDHKGRPGATRPGASSFGAIGGLTCYFMAELTRDGLFAALRARHHYGTTGARIFLDLHGHFEEPVTVFSDDPQLGPVQEHRRRSVQMGDIVRPGPAVMRLAAEVRGTAPIDQVDVFYGSRLAATVHPYRAADLGRRVRVLWQGAEYRGRGRETIWQGRLRLEGNPIVRFAPVNFLNPERKVCVVTPETELAWSSVTTGNLAGIDLWFDAADRGTLDIETNIVSGRVDLASLADRRMVFEGGGLGRQLSVYRLPDQDWSRRIVVDHAVRFSGVADLPVYLRVTQADGHQAWSSPIYLIP
ncbi:DUF3604 domain-containing protein [Bradyrhizobium sp. Pear77]|uniref:DUF3604 domain-containing protein n=1 Tax=Bradyrhizobium altum TaxID=1571202 RepID=UPI001E5A68FF|nr:DUF3604 domain-containing protein [Bradyrhizobium altum]MCC8954689.1 DUF3604 domain-containing protein [Bradyrhizobium altum]